ncbi:MAG: phage terminase large subunit, partial [Bryobacteraceae bacterium]
MSSANEQKGDTNESSEELCWAYEPLPSQSQFEQLRTRLKGFSGSVGSGKSAALCFEAVRQAYLNRGRKGLLAAPTLAMLRDATVAGLVEMLEHFDIDFDTKKADGELVIKSAHGTILLRSLDEPERLRGTNLAWFGIDELSYAREESWLRLEARLRDPKAKSLCGFAAWTPQGHDWIYKRFVRTSVSGYGCIQAKPFENRFLLDKTPDYYERLESSYDPKFYRQEALGEYLNSRTDRVYHCFTPAVHLSEQKYDRAKPLLWALDFNVAPMTSVIAQRHHDQVYVIDEIVLDRATTEEACQEFANRYRNHSAGVEVYGDASGRNMHTTGSNDYTM